MQLRTTVRLEESLLEQAKAEAARRNTTLTALVEQGLHMVIKEGQAPAHHKKYELPISDKTGGPMPGINISNSAELWDILDGYIDPAGR
jgi:hypothetical protein